MAIGVQSFPIQQGSATSRGMRNAEELFAAQLMNRLRREQAIQTEMKTPFVQPELEEALKQSQFLTQIKGNEAKYAEPMSKAELAQKAAATKSTLGHLGLAYSADRRAQSAEGRAQSAEGRAAKEAEFNSSELGRLMKMPGVAGQLGTELYLRQLEKQHQTNPNPFPAQESLQQPQQQGAGGQFGTGDLTQALLNAQKQQSPQMRPQEMPKNEYGEAADLLKQQLTANVQKQNALAKYREAQTTGYTFNQMPPDTKRAAVAQLVGAGYTNDEAVRGLVGGKTVEGMMAEKGYTDQSQYPNLQFAPQQTAINRQQIANTARAGMNAVDKNLTDALKKYAKTWNGKSIQLLKDSLSGKSDEEVGKAVGAAGLQIELAGLRGKTAGFNNMGVEMLNHFVETSKNKIDLSSLALNPAQYEYAQNFINEQFNIIGDAENQAMFGTAAKQREQPKKEERDIESGKSNDPLGIR